MLKANIKEYIYQVLDKLSEKYKTELKTAKTENRICATIKKLTDERDKR